MKEAEIQRQIQEYLTRQYPPPDSRLFRLAVNSLKGRNGAMVRNPLRGVPDLWLLTHGRSIFFEIKTKDGMLSDIQKTKHIEIRAAGGFVAIVTSVEEVKHAMEAARQVWRIR